jgi:hypothetical protein
MQVGVCGYKLREFFVKAFSLNVAFLLRKRKMINGATEIYAKPCE